MRPEVRAVIQRIRDTIAADPTTWTQGENARDSDGAEIGEHSPHATCWCLIGFANKFATTPGLNDQVYSAIRTKANINGYVSAWNDRDGRKPEEVIAALDQVLAS